MVSADVQSYVVTFLLFALQSAGHTYSSYMGAFLEEYLVLMMKKCIYIYILTCDT